MSNTTTSKPASVPASHAVVWMCAPGVESELGKAGKLKKKEKKKKTKHSADEAEKEFDFSNPINMLDSDEDDDDDDDDPDIEPVQPANDFDVEMPEGLCVHCSACRSLRGSWGLVLVWWAGPKRSS